LEREPAGHAAWIETVIYDFLDSPENTLGLDNGERAFGEPLVGFSRGDDPLYQAYKEYVGDFHWTPSEIFLSTFPETRMGAEELTVISWVLPQTDKTKADNREEVLYPCERWARARIYGEEVNRELRAHVVEALQSQGYRAVAPMLSAQWERRKSERYGFASTWSERHAAYASGLVLWGENSMTYFQAANFWCSSNLDNTFFRSSWVNFHSNGSESFSYSLWKLRILLSSSSRLSKSLGVRTFRCRTEK